MKTIINIRNCQMIMIMVLITMAGGCKKEEPEPEPEQIPTVTTEVSEISSTSAVCAGNITSCEGDWGSSDSNVYRGIYWSNINLKPAISGEHKNYTSMYGCRFSIVLDRLTPGTTYYVRAFTENITGVGYGNVI